MKRMKRLFLLLLAAALLLSGCGQTAAETAPAEEQETQEEIYPEVTPLEEVDLEDEAVALAGEPAVSTLLLPEASGTLVQSNGKAVIDYSNTADGYVMVKYTAATTKRLKVQVKGPGHHVYIQSGGRRRMGYLPAVRRQRGVSGGGV